MKEDKELLDELNDLLDHFRDQHPKAEKVCEKELSRLRGMLNHAASKFQSTKSGFYAQREESPFLEILLTIKNVMKSIDDEARLLEKEMRGVDNYSDYAYMNIINFAFKKELKEALMKMLNLIRNERPGLRDKEPFISI